MAVRLLPCVAIEGVEALTGRLLDDEERHKAKAFHHAADRRAYIAAHALLRSMLSYLLRNDGEDRDSAPTREASEWRFTRGIHGKPALAPGQTAGRVRFNLSHCRGMVAVVLAAGIEVGIDIETFERAVSDDIAIARANFATGEQAFLDTIGDPLERQRAFLELWTAKEAFLKATGHGLSLPLDSFSVDPQRERYDHLPSLPEISGHSWQLFRWTVQTHLVALATGQKRNQNQDKQGDEPLIDCRLAAWDTERASLDLGNQAIPPHGAPLSR